MKKEITNIKYEVSEVLNVLNHHLFTHTKNAGFVSLADVKGNFIYVWVDYDEYFDNVDQADAAQRDVDKFVRFWKSKGKKLYITRRYNIMTTLELLQWENEIKGNNFYEKGEDMLTNEKIENKEGEPKL